jgi:hypothetical protein
LSWGFSIRSNDARGVPRWSWDGDGVGGIFDVKDGKSLINCDDAVGNAAAGNCSSDETVATSALRQRKHGARTGHKRLYPEWPLEFSHQNLIGVHSRPQGCKTEVMTFTPVSAFTAAVSIRDDGTFGAAANPRGAQGYAAGR